MEKCSWRACLVATCVSFTAAILLSALLAWWLPEYMAVLGQAYVLELFVVTSVVNVLLTVSHNRICEGIFADMLLDLWVVLFGVLGLGGGLFHWFPWQPVYIIEVIGILLMVYFVTYSIMFLQNRELARKINEQIKKCKAQKNFHS